MRQVVVTVLITTAAWLISFAASHPADHREDTVLPFSLSPGNVNLETYYLDKYPQPGVPGGPLVKQSTSQMTPSPLDPVPVPEAGGNMFLVHKTEDPHAMFRTRRAARPQVAGYHYPNGGHNHGSMVYGLHNEDNLHLQTYPRNGYPNYEHQPNIHHHQHNHVSSHNHHHDHHQQRHHTHHEQQYGRY